MARTWPIEGATFLQDKVSLHNSHMHLWEAIFPTRAPLATVTPHVSHPVASCPVGDFRWTVNSDEMIFPGNYGEMTTSTQPLWLFYCLRLCTSESRPSQFHLFLEPEFSYAFKKMSIFSFPFLIYLFSFYCSTCILWHWKSNKASLLVTQLVYYWFELLIWQVL